MSTISSILFIVVTYVLVVLLSYFYHSPYNNSVNFSTYQSNITYAMPLVSKKNITSVTKDRFQSITNDYIKVLSDKNWKLLRKSTNITVETLQADNDEGWPYYIKTIASFNKSNKKLYSYFLWSEFDKTQKKMDPFYDKSSLLLDINKDIKLIRKTTKKVFILPKREFILALTQNTQNKDIKIAVTNQLYSPIRNATEYTIKKGTQVQLWASLKLNDDYNYLPKFDDSIYERAYQDFIAWFVDDNEGGSYLVIVMRVDLGSDIPRWLFTTTVAATGIWSIQSLQKYVNNDKD